LKSNPFTCFGSPRKEGQFDFNAPIKYEGDGGKFSRPEKTSFLAGFKEVIGIVRKQNKAFVDWAEGLAAKNIITRIVTLATPTMKTLRFKTFHPRSSNCRSLMLFTSWSEYLSYKDFAATSVFENDCQMLINGLNPADRYSVPVFYLKFNLKKMFYADLQTTTHLDVESTKKWIEPEATTTTHLDVKSTKIGTKKEPTPAEVKYKKILDAYKNLQQNDNTILFLHSGKETLLLRINDLQDKQKLDKIIDDVTKLVEKFPVVTRK